MTRRVHLHGNRIYDDPNGESVVLDHWRFEVLLATIERYADWLQVEVIYRQLAERRLMELEERHASDD